MYVYRYTIGEPSQLGKGGASKCPQGMSLGRFVTGASGGSAGAAGSASGGSMEMSVGSQMKTLWTSPLSILLAKK